MDRNNYPHTQINPGPTIFNYQKMNEYYIIQQNNNSQSSNNNPGCTSFPSNYQDNKNDRNPYPNTFVYNNNYNNNNFNPYNFNGPNNNSNNYCNNISNNNLNNFDKNINNGFISNNTGQSNPNIYDPNNSMSTNNKNNSNNNINYTNERKEINDIPRGHTQQYNFKKKSSKGISMVNESPFSNKEKLNENKDNLKLNTNIPNKEGKGKTVKINRGKGGEEGKEENKAKIVDSCSEIRLPLEYNDLSFENGKN